MSRHPWALHLRVEKEDGQLTLAGVGRACRALRDMRPAPRVDRPGRTGRSARLSRADVPRAGRAAGGGIVTGRLLTAREVGDLLAEAPSW